MHTASISGVEDDHPFQKERISDRLTRIRMPGNVFTYYYRGDESGILIDTGLGYGSFRTFLEDPASHLAAGQPYQVLLTHGHLDHAGGAGEFEHVLLSSSDHALALQHGNPSLRAEYLRANGIHRPVSEICRQLTPPCTADSLLPVEEEVSLAIAPETLHVFSLPGHTPGSLVILLEQARLLLAGDALNSWTLLFAAPDSPPMEEYHTALCILRQKIQGRFDQVLYSHPHNVGGPEILDQMIALTGDILAGKNEDASAILRLGKPALLAKPVDPKTLLRRDGGAANLVYDPDNLYTSQRKESSRRETPAAGGAS